MGPFDFMKQAKKFQESFKNIQKEIADMEVEGIAGAGLVKITMSGQYQTRKVFIDDSLLKEEKKILEELIQAAISDATNKVEKAQKDKMGGMMSGMGLPLEGMNFPFMPGAGGNS